jgi:hypothetical protein
MLLRCGEQYRRRYIQGEVIPPSASLIRGSCGHKALEKNFRQKVLTRNDLPFEELQDTFSDHWDKEKYGIVLREDELDGDSPVKALGRFKDSGVALLNCFHREASPLIQPVHVEDKFEIRFDGSFPPVIGVIDRIDEGDEIGEVKFVGKSPPKDDVNHDIQLTVYDLGHRQKYGRPPKKLRKQWAVDLKTPKTVSQEAEPRSQETIERLMWRFQSVINALEKGVFLPADAGSWACSEKWCGFWSTCKYRP